jgi:hypothetical protein
MSSMKPVAYASKKAIKNITDNPKLYHYLPVNGDAERGKTAALYALDPEKIADLVRDAFYEGCRDMQSWNGTLGPMSEEEVFCAWMESESRKSVEGFMSASHIAGSAADKSEGPGSTPGAGSK